MTVVIWLAIYLVGAIVTWLVAYRWLANNTLTFSKADLRWSASVLALVWPLTAIAVLVGFVLYRMGEL